MDADAHPSVATREELLRRLRGRTAPHFEMALTPADLTREVGTKTAFNENERRIALLRSSLNGARDQCETEHSFARLAGYAAANFEKER